MALQGYPAHPLGTTGVPRLPPWQTDLAEDRALRVGAAVPPDVALLLCRLLRWNRRRFGTPNP